MSETRIACVQADIIHAGQEMHADHAPVAFQKPAMSDPSVACVQADMIHAATTIGWSGK